MNRINELALNKQKTDNPKDAFIALKREQEYLADLYDKLHPNEHRKELMHNIQKAYEVDKTGEIAKLYKTAYYANQQKIISPEELTEHFKSNKPVDDIHHNVNHDMLPIKKMDHVIEQVESIREQDHQFTPELIKEVESGEELCITNRGKKVAFIIPVRKYYAQKSNDLFKKLNVLKKRTRIGKADDIIELKNLGRK